MQCDPLQSEVHSRVNFAISGRGNFCYNFILIRGKVVLLWNHCVECIHQSIQTLGEANADVISMGLGHVPGIRWRKLGDAWQSSFWVDCHVYHLVWTIFRPVDITYRRDCLVDSMSESHDYQMSSKERGEEGV